MTERQSLARFEAENSPEGLLRRYARGRVRHFVPRQIATVAGSLALALLVSLEEGQGSEQQGREGGRHRPRVLSPLRGAGSVSGRADPPCGDREVLHTGSRSEPVS